MVWRLLLEAWCTRWEEWARDRDRELERQCLQSGEKDESVLICCRCRPSLVVGDSSLCIPLSDSMAGSPVRVRFFLWMAEHILTPLGPHE